MQPPQTQYVERDGISIAYQVVGEGPIDLLVAPGFISHLDLQWTDPRLARCISRLASFARLIMYDKPGTGLSDPILHLPTLEERGAEIEAVLDAAGSERAVLLGISEGGPSSIVIAATRPERITSLIVYGTFAVWPTAAPEDFSPETVVSASRRSIASWKASSTAGATGQADGTLRPKCRRAAEARGRAPSRGRRRVREWQGARRDLCSDRHARRAVVGDVPTLVLHVDDDLVIPVEMGERLARASPGRASSSTGQRPRFWMGDAGPILDEIERFVTGGVHHAEPSRVLVTVLFTDIVASTTRAAQLGDSAWRELLQRHDALIDRAVVRTPRADRQAHRRRGALGV